MCYFFKGFCLLTHDLLYFFKECLRFLFKGFYLLTDVLISLREIFKSFLKPSISIMSYDFKSKSCFSGMLGYPGLVVVGELGLDGAILP